MTNKNQLFFLVFEVFLCFCKPALADVNAVMLQTLKMKPNFSLHFLHLILIFSELHVALLAPELGE